MCRKGNQSVSKECWNELVRITGRSVIPDKEVHRLIKSKGGCLKLDEKRLVTAQ